MNLESLNLSDGDRELLNNHPELLRIALDLGCNPVLSPPENLQEVLEKQAETILKHFTLEKSEKEQLQQVIQRFKWRYDLAFLGMTKVILTAPITFIDLHYKVANRSKTNPDWKMSEETRSSILYRTSPTKVLQFQWSRELSPNGGRPYDQSKERVLSLCEGLWAFFHNRSNQPNALALYDKREGNFLLRWSFELVLVKDKGWPLNPDYHVPHLPTCGKG